MDPATLALPRAAEPLFDQGHRQGHRPGLVHDPRSRRPVGGRDGALEHRGGRHHSRNLVASGAGRRHRLPQPARPDGALAPGAGLVLLVDDEDLIRTSTAQMLGDMGYVVIEVASAREALPHLDDPRIDLLITDHLMPGMSGTELAREAQAKRPNLPILIISGFAEVEDVAPRRCAACLEACVPRQNSPAGAGDAGLSWRAATYREMGEPADAPGGLTGNVNSNFKPSGSPFPADRAAQLLLQDRVDHPARQKPASRSLEP